MNIKLYHLEIYCPGSAHDVQVSFESDTPFLSISKGDLFNPRVWKGNDLKGLMKATAVEHIVWESGNSIIHKVCVFTALVPDNESSRS